MADYQVRGVVYTLLFLVLLNIPQQALASRISKLMQKGTLQGQIPNIDLSRVDSRIKNFCHAKAVSRAGFDPFGAQAKSNLDHKNEFFATFGRNLAREYVYRNSRGYQIQQNIEARKMKDRLKAYSDLAQTYVRVYKMCLETKLAGQES